VRLLERAELILGGGVLAGEADERAPREPGDCEAGDGVGEAAPGGHREHAGPPRAARVAIGGVRTRLLVAHVDHLDPVVAQVAQNRPGVSAIDREQELDALLAEHAADDASAVSARGLGAGQRPSEGIAHLARAVHADQRAGGCCGEVGFLRLSCAFMRSIAFSSRSTASSTRLAPASARTAAASERVAAASARSAARSMSAPALAVAAAKRGMASAATGIRMSAELVGMRAGCQPADAHGAPGG